MQSGKIISLSVWLMILFNLVLAFAAVWSIQRMGPEIKQIYERNVVSLEASENMFLALNRSEVDFQAFGDALTTAENNITEQGEKEALAKIRSNLEKLKNGDTAARESIIGDIRELSLCNRDAIRASAERTQRMRRAGAWGIVFMTLLFFGAALLFEQRLRRSLLQPLQEIQSVLEARRTGDHFRRCSSIEASSDMRKLFQSINALLDRSDRK